MDSLYSVEQDWQSALGTFAPVTGRVGLAPASAQGGPVVLCVDSTTGKLRPLNTDANGNLQAVQVTASGLPLTVTGGASPGALSTQTGVLMFGRQDSPAPAAYQPLIIDGVGALQVHAKSKPTHRAVLAGVVTALNKPLLSVFNGSASQFIRIQNIALYIPQQSIQGTLLGSSTVTYYPVYCEVRRITGHAVRTGASVSTTLSCVTSDSADTLDAGVTVMSNAVLSGLATAAYYRGDANNNGMGAEWYQRSDVNAKTLVLRPGEGMAVVCASNGLVASGAGTVQGAIDVGVAFTQAAA